MSAARTCKSRLTRKEETDLIRRRPEGRRGRTVTSNSLMAEKPDPKLQALTEDYKEWVEGKDTDVNDTSNYH